MKWKVEFALLLAYPQITEAKFKGVNFVIKLVAPPNLQERDYVVFDEYEIQAKNLKRAKEKVRPLLKNQLASGGMLKPLIMKNWRIHEEYVERSYLAYEDIGNIHIYRIRLAPAGDITIADALSREEYERAYIRRRNAIIRQNRKNIQPAAIPGGSTESEDSLNRLLSDMNILIEEDTP